MVAGVVVYLFPWLQYPPINHAAVTSRYKMQLPSCNRDVEDEHKKRALPTSVLRATDGVGKISNWCKIREPAEVQCTNSAPVATHIQGPAYAKPIHTCGASTWARQRIWASILV